MATVGRTMIAFLRRVQQTCDAWLDGYYHRIVFLLLGGMVAFTGAHGYALTSDWEQWTVGEWLVSYSGGFVRRGLSGELLLAVSRSTGVAVNDVVFAAFFILFAVFSAFFALLLRRKRITFWYLFLCLWPASLLFTVHNPAAVGRQELLLYVGFVLWAMALSRGPLSRPTLVAFGVFACAATLVHELFLLFTPYFVLLAFLTLVRTARGHWKQSLVVPACSLIALLAILLFSRTLDAAALCDRLTAAGAPASVCNGLFEYGDPKVSNQLLDFIGHLNRHIALSLLLVFPIVLLPVYLFLTTTERLPVSSSQVVAVLGVFILVSAPLFLLAVDWGRWISIHVVLSTIGCALLLTDIEAGAHARPRARFAVPYVFVGVLVLSTTLLWSVKYCCGDEYLNALGPVHELRSQLRLVGI